jgi:hypothetical protein
MPLLVAPDCGACRRKALALLHVRLTLQRIAGLTQAAAAVAAAWLRVTLPARGMLPLCRPATPVHIVHVCAAADSQGLCPPDLVPYPPQGLFSSPCSPACTMITGVGGIATLGLVGQRQGCHWQQLLGVPGRAQQQQQHKVVEQGCLLAVAGSLGTLACLTVW